MAPQKLTQAQILRLSQIQLHDAVKDWGIVLRGMLARAVYTQATGSTAKVTSSEAKLAKKKEGGAEEATGSTVLQAVWNLPESEQRQLLVELLEKFSFSPEAKLAKKNDDCAGEATGSTAKASSPEAELEKKNENSAEEENPFDEFPASSPVASIKDLAKSTASGANATQAEQPQEKEGTAGPCVGDDENLEPKSVQEKVCTPEKRKQTADPDYLWTPADKPARTHLFRSGNVSGCKYEVFQSCKVCDLEKCPKYKYVKTKGHHGAVCWFCWGRMTFHGRKHLELKNAGRLEDFSPEQVKAIIAESKQLREEHEAKDAAFCRKSKKKAKGKKNVQKKAARGRRLRKKALMSKASKAARKA